MKKISIGADVDLICLKIAEFCKTQSLKFDFYRMALIILTGVVAYSNTLNVPFIFDDFTNIVSDPMIADHSLSGFQKSLHSRRAFGAISFQISHFFSGLNVTGYHLANILIHIAAALTVYRLLQLLMKTEYITGAADVWLRELPLPFFCALLFVAHPVQTQSVTYIVQRLASLATLCYLLSIVSFLNGRINQVNAAKMLTARSTAWFAASLIFGILAFYTKEIAYTLPGAIVLLELLFFRNNLKKIIALVVGGAALLLAVFFKLLSSAGSIDAMISKIDAVTRIQTSSVISRSDYLFTQLWVVVSAYIRLIFLPVKQRVEYDYPLLSNFWDWRVLCSFVLIVLLLGGAVWMIIKSRNCLPHFRFIAFGILFFFLGLSIESSFMPIIDLVFEHRLYLPSLGAFTAITTVMLISTKEKNIYFEGRIFTGLLLIVAVLTISSYNRNSVWKSEVSLWTDNVAKSPASARAWHNLGAAHIKVKDPMNALKATIRSIELDRSGAAAWNNLGIALDLFGAYNDRFNRTTEMFTEPGSVTEININKWQGEVNNALGLAYEVVGNYEKARENYRNAIGYNPALGVAYYNLGILSAFLKDFQSYSEQLQILWMIDPVFANRLQARVQGR